MIEILLLFEWVLQVRGAIECGVRAPISSPLIVNGQYTLPGQWPWHAAISHRAYRRSPEYKCGGTLISEWFVLTAAHCVTEGDGSVLAPEIIAVQLGVHDLDDTSMFAESRRVIAIFKALSFIPETFRNDIAILKLRSNAEYNNYVRPACLYEADDLAKQVGTAIGYGLTETDVFSNKLKRASMPVIGTFDCLDSDRDYFGKILAEGMLCAGHINGSSVCNGDSGGGLFVKSRNKWYLAGIVSQKKTRDDDTTSCHVESYAIFTKVSYYVPWIQNVTGLLSEHRNVADLPMMSTSSETTDDWTHLNLNLLPKDCGESSNDRIAFGEATKVFAYPWMAILRYEYKSAIQDGCGGSIINKRYILTAAQCIKTRDAMPLHSVVLGEHTKNQDIDCNMHSDSLDEETERDCAEPIEVFGIESTTVHPDYNRPRYSNDIGLIRLDKDIVMKDHIRPICLPVTSVLQKATLGNYIFTGWGTTEQKTASDKLLRAYLPYVDNSECQRKMNENRLNIRLGDKQMCAGGTNRADACKGDAGGPLGNSARYNGSRFVQFGIVSSGVTSCGVHSVPGVYSRVASYMDWILDTMKA